MDIHKILPIIALTMGITCAAGFMWLMRRKSTGQDYVDVRKKIKDESK